MQSAFLLQGQAHPRECGDDIFAGGGIPVGLGSPPRMRGRLAMWQWRLEGMGLTPANAGTT